MTTDPIFEEAILEGEAVGQNEPRWRRLRGLIDHYPRDSGILKELIQNADDGQARRVEIILDETDYSDVTVHQALKSIVGPAILAYNDKPFTSQDFKNLESLANSAKIEDAFKTGRFGLGFNSVYNVTDYPVLLSADKLWCLDPCESLFRKSAGGVRWDIGKIMEKDRLSGFLKLFEHAHYRHGDREFQGTALRLPLRSKGHIEQNQDPSAGPGIARISSQPFDPDTFLELVDGLAKIAHELLLFLKNVESVSCSRIHPDGSREALLEISIENPEKTREGRGTINHVLQSGKLADVLDACTEAEDGRIEASFQPQIRVLMPGGKVENSLWQIVSGLYAGDDEALVEASHQLTEHGERGLPHAGVALCLKRDGQVLPQISGKVFCYLPIADKDYSGKLPLHIHGAFSLDDSRTSLTSHREDEHGKSAARAAWNDLLIEHAVAPAYARALVEITTLEAELAMELQDLAQALYRLFPPVPSSLSSHMGQLAGFAYGALAAESIFLDAHDHWEPAETLYELPDDHELKECLRLEKFSFARPALPKKVFMGLSEQGLQPEHLTAEIVIEHFRTSNDDESSDEGSESLEWTIEDHPFAGLRSREHLLAVIRFLIDEKAEDWSDLPLALCEDVKVRFFRDETPMIVTTSRQADILAFCPNQLIDLEAAVMLDELDFVPSGLAYADAETWLDKVKEFLETDEDILPTLTGAGDEIPNLAWLVTVLNELNELKEDERPSKESLQVVPLVPDSEGQLWQPGTKATPLLLELREKSMGELLDSVGVPYFVLSPSPLSSALRSFADRYGRVWFLKAGDLIDSLHNKTDELDETRDDWARSGVVDPLLKFLENHWTQESLGADTDRIQELQELPLFEDRAGHFGPVDDSCFIPGAFEVPADLIGLRLLKMSPYPKLQAALGVRALSRLNLLKHWLLPKFRDLALEAQWEWLKWIRDEWNRLLGEIEGGAKSLRELISEYPIIPTESGGLVESENCYHPAEREFIVSVIGDGAEFPAVSIDGEEGPLWSEFFEHLELSRSPDTQDIADQIWQWVDQVKSEGLTGKNRMGLIQLAKHLFNHWEQHREEYVTAPGEDDDEELSTVLRDLAWLPAASGEELKDYFAAEEPEQRLYCPGELIPFQQGRLVGSMKALLPRQLIAPSSQLQEDLDIRFKPNWEEVASHFENVLDAVGEGPFTNEEMEILKPSLQAIYRFFGENAQMFEGVDDDADSANPLASRFAKRSCIIVPQQRRFYLPSDVYRTCPRSLEPIKFKVSAKDPTIEKGYDVLGRSESPDIHDLGRSLVSLAESREGALNLELVNAVNSLLRHLGVLMTEDQPDQLPEIFVLNALGELVVPSMVLEANDSYLQGHLQIEEGLLLHPDTPLKIIHSWGIRGLRNAEGRPVAYSPADDEAFLQRCSVAARIIRLPEFLEGIRRLVYHCHGGQPPNLNQTLEFRMEPSSGLLCSYSVHMGGERLELGRARAEFCFHKIEGSPALLIDQECQDIFFERLAEALSTVLGDNAPTDRVALVKILQQDSPGSIERVLDRLHVRRLPAAEVESRPDEEEDERDYFGEDSPEESDDEGVSSGGASTIQPEVEEPDDDGDDPDEVSEGEGADDEEIEDGAESDSNDDEESETRRTYGGAAGGAAGETSQGGETRRRSGGGAAGSRGRMLPGANGNGSGQRRTGTGARQQNALWISRPKPEQSERIATQEKDDDHNDEQRPNHPIGKAAVGLVLAYERSQGRKPQNMAHANPGYDIESKAGRVIERYIEVKGMDGEWGINGVPLSAIQFKHAQEKGEQYWLYVVENARDPENARIHMIQNPFGKITQHRFDHGWKNAAKTASMKGLPQPKEGSILVVMEADGSIEKEGVITDVRENENQVWLQVRYEEGGPATNVVFDPTCMIVRRP
jgi:hypothetical protein